MSVVLRAYLLMVLLFSCQSEETIKAPVVKGESPYFTTNEVVLALNALVATIDWPQDTVPIQKNLSIDPESAKKLILPLHPIWDEKIMEVASEIPTWGEDKIKAVISDCSKKCECEFFQEVLDRNPAILENGSVELKNLAGLKVIKSKETTLKCFENLPSLQKILDHLRSQLKNFESESVI